MIRRIFWITVGVGGTIYVLRKVNRISAATGHLTPGGIAAAVGDLAESLKEMTAELSASMAEQEQALTQALLAEETEAAGPRGSRRGRHRDTWESEFAFDEGDPEEYF